MPISQWNPEAIQKAALDRMEVRMHTATTVLKSGVQSKLNRSNAGGTKPSVPGEPPRKGTGDLFNSIFNQVTRTKTDIVGWVGSRLLKARRLELGYVGKDSLGRTIDQAPRPFLRSTYFELRDRLKKILIGGRQ